MPVDAARAFNRRCPPGSLVEVTLRSGDTRTGRTRGPAIVWAGYALIEVENLAWLLDGRGGVAACRRCTASADMHGCAGGRHRMRLAGSRPDRLTA
ncbi:MAG: hypothetical protein ACR2J7_09545 [Luteimonas sp.]